MLTKDNSQMKIIGRRRFLAKMTTVIALVTFVVLILGFTFGMGDQMHSFNNKRSFSIDTSEDTFLMNGRPFRYVSGSFHYFRALPEAWPKRLRTMRAAGLNAIDTYVEWSLHNPHDGVYKWDGIANLEKFLELAQAEGFYIILRPGPYICAERDNGGLPYWLFNKYPNIKPRTSDEDYLNEVNIWYSKLMPRLQRFLYGNGGNIIMVQVENEYGAFAACDKDYLNWLRDETEKYVHGQALLFTTDIPDPKMLKCGKIDGVFATVDFGIKTPQEIEDIWSNLRKVQPNGPKVNSEFYPGWLTHWQEPNQRRDAKQVTNTLRTILASGASVNFYMFFGGTNFGFTAGANDFGTNGYVADITSYDYDAVMDETGNITEKFLMVRDVIKEYLKSKHLPPIPPPTPRKSYGEVQLRPIVDLLSQTGRSLLSEDAAKISESPLTFEMLDQYSGLVLYETELPLFKIDPSLLTVNDLRDRALVYVNQNFVGVLSRGSNIYSLPINAGLGTKLQLLVENQGRINFNIADDTKGIFGDIILQGKILTNWTSTTYPLENLNNLIAKYKEGKIIFPTFNDVGDTDSDDKSMLLRNGPKVFYGYFDVKEIADTFLNPLGWGKGVAYVNGFNLGRYWPLAGPQITLYVPNELLKIGKNSLILLEYQKSKLKKVGNENFGVVTLDDKPQLDG